MKEKIHAAFVHFMASAAVSIIAAALVFFVWYVAPLDRAIGVGSIFLLMLGIDAVLGPALTAMVYKRGKKSLRFDLTIIVLVQVCALSYGLFVVASSRPAWLVFNAGRFDVAQADDLDRRYLQQARPEFRSPSWMGPKWVASANPEDAEARQNLVLESAMGGPDLPQRVDLYVPLETQRQALQEKAEPLENLSQFNRADEIDVALKKWPQADAWLPLMAREKPMVVLIDRVAGKPLAVVDLRPWA